MQKDINTEEVQVDKAATEEERKSIFARIFELIRRTRLKLYETFVELPDAQAIEKHLNKAESAAKKLSEVEDLSTAALAGVYEISEKIDAAIQSNNFEEISKLYDELVKLHNDVIENTSNRLEIKYKTIKEAVQNIYSEESNLCDFYSEDLLAQARVMMSADGKEGYMVFPAEFTDASPDEKFDVVIKLRYNGNNDIKFDYLPNCEINLENGKYVLTDDTNKKKTVEFFESRNFAKTNAYSGELTVNVINCVASIEGVKAKDETLKVKSAPMKIIEKYRKNNVVDKYTGCISTFEPDDNTFRVYDPDTKKLMVFYNKDKTTLCGCVYDNVPSYDAPIYKRVDDLQQSGIVTKYHYDTSKELYERTDFLTLKENEDGKTAQADMKLPYGDIDIQTMLKSESVTDCLITYGLKNFGIREITTLADKKNVVTDKTHRKVDKGYFLSLAQTVKDAMFASHIGVDGTINDKLDFEESHKVIYEEGGHTITVRTPSNAQMRLMTDKVGTPVSIAYSPAGDTEFYNVYNPSQAKVMVAPSQLKEWRDNDDEFNKTFEAINAAINVEINKGRDVGVEYSKKLEKDRETAMRERSKNAVKDNTRDNIKDNTETTTKKEHRENSKDRE